MEEDSIETGWLVEGTRNAQAVWLCVSNSTFWWSSDSLLALRLSRREDGEDMIRYLCRDLPPGTEVGLTVTFHEWM